MPEQKEIELTNWADAAADVLLQRNKASYICEGMWTPSGYFHIGNARTELFTPYAVHHALENRGYNSTQLFIIDDFDDIKKIPSGLEIKESEYEKFIGFPCALAPSPLPGYNTWADAFVIQVKDFIPNFGIEPKIISAYETYKAGKFNDLIIHSLNNSEKIVDVWNRVSGSEKSKSFLPVKILCPDCGKLAFTTALEWNGKEITYKCKCGSTGLISPLNGNSKLHWRVHWSAFWAYNKVDFESGGKDHFSKGGSVDVSQAFMKEIFNLQGPYQLPTEFIQVKGAKMAGSVGNVITLEEWLKVAQPETFRFLNFSYKPNKAIDFSLKDNSFVLLMERFERAERIYYNLEEDRSEKLNNKIKREYELSVAGQTSKETPIQIAYQFATFLSQIHNPETQLPETITLLKVMGHLPKTELTIAQKEKIQKKLIRAKYWVENYAPDEFKIAFTDSVSDDIINEISQTEKKALSEIASNMQNKSLEDEIKQTIFDSAKANEIQPKRMFQLLYLLLIGKSQGPQIGTLILALGKERCISRLKEII
ncbi:MAG: lysine--tRNA ligase [Candidatus Diapherotrites archaeon]